LILIMSSIISDLQTSNSLKRAYSKFGFSELYLNSLECWELLEKIPFIPYEYILEMCNRNYRRRNIFECCVLYIRHVHAICNQIKGCIINQSLSKNMLCYKSFFLLPSCLYCCLDNGWLIEFEINLVVSKICRTETEYVSQMLTLIKRFAQHHGCHVWFVAHPRQVGNKQLWFHLLSFYFF